MNTIKLRKDRNIVIVLCLLDAILWIALFATLILGSTGGFELQILFSAAAAVLLAAATRSIARWKLMFDENGVSCTPMIGRTKRLAYGEILRITIGQGYVIYDQSGSKWAVFADDSANALQAINLMKSAGVKVDLF